MNSYGFIIIRHVNSKKTNKYWNTCVQCLRKLYFFKKIVIIDDNSNQEFVKSDYDYKNVEIIQSDYHGRGELLPYYYYLKNKFFDNAIIIHDSVFFHKRINFEKIIGLKVVPLWYFNSDKENLDNTLRITNSLKNNYNIHKLLSMNDSILSLNFNKWYGCFGVQSFINHTFLLYLEKKYNISNMVHSVKCRSDRCSLERIFGSIFFTESSKLCNIKSLFGNIHKYQKWGYTYDNYEKDINNKKIIKPIIKIWTGR